MEVQIDPIKPELKPPGTKRLKLKCDVLLLNFAFKFNLRRYAMGSMPTTSDMARIYVGVLDELTWHWWGSPELCSPRRPPGHTRCTLLPGRSIVPFAALLERHIVRHQTRLNFSLLGSSDTL